MYFIILIVIHFFCNDVICSRIKMQTLSEQFITMELVFSRHTVVCRAAQEARGACKRE